MKTPSQRRLWNLLVLLLITSAALTPIRAQITVDGSTTWDSAFDPGTFDANTYDKLVVVVTGEHNFPGNLTGNVTGITYNGQTLIKAVEVSPADPAGGGHGQTTSDIWYLDNPALYAGAGTIDVSFTGNNWVVTAMGLSGAADGVGATSSISGAASVDLTTTDANSLVIAAVGMGGQGNTATVASVDPNPPLTEISALEIGNNWSGHVTGSVTVATAGPGTHSFDTTRTDIVTIAAEFLLDSNPPDMTPPTLAGSDIVDNAGGGPVNEVDTVIYTVTFSEAMNTSTIDVTDFENGGFPAATIKSVTGTGNSAVFEVSVSPGGPGTLQLQIAAGANLEDLAGNAMDTASPIADDTTITVEGDVTAPTLAGTDIVDNVGGGPVFETQPVVYTVTFSEAMHAASVEASDFENGGSPSAAIHSVFATANPAVFTVAVIPGGAGTLQLQVRAGAVLTDLAGNPLLTASAIADGTIITVNAGSPPSGTIPNQIYPANEEFEIISPQLGTRHLNQPSVINGYAVFAGNAIHEVWNIANPYAPTIEATMTSNHASGEAESHQVTYGRDGAGSYYFAATSGRGIDIWNVTNATSPVYVKALELPGINYGDVAGGVWGLSWQGDYIYVGATSNGLYVIDASNPSNASHVATLPVSGLGAVWPGPVFALGNLLVITTPKNRAGVATVDISDPLNPVLLDSVNPGGNSYIGGFYGTHAWLIGTLRGYDVTTDPGNIAQTSSTSIPSSEYMSWADDHLFLGGLRGGTEGIWKYDASDPNNLTLVGRVNGRDSRWDDQFSCPAGNLLLIADDQNVGGYVGGVVAVHDTQPDTTPLTVKYVNPPNGSTDQPLSGQIGISFSEWPEFTSVDPSSFILRKPGGAAVSGKWGCTYTTVTFAPDAPLDPNTVYEVVLPAGGITDLVGNAIATTFTATFTTGASGGGTPGIDGLDDLNLPPPVPLGTASNFSVKTPQGGDTYNWDFGDGNSATGPSVSRTYAAPGRYSVQFEVIVGGGGQSQLFAFTHIVHNPLTASKPSSGQPIAFEGTSVWAVNPDAGTVTALDRDTLVKLHEVSVGARPKSIARAPDGTLWVVCEDSWEIDVIDPASPAVIDTIDLPYASQPVGLAMAPDGSAAYVTLQALGRLVKLDPATRAITAHLDFALDPSNPETRPKVRGVAVNGASDTVLVTRHISPDASAEVFEVDASTMTLTRTINLAKDPGPDGSQNSRGLPNYLTGITISPDGLRAWVASKKDNIDRGGALDGLPLQHDVTVRSITSSIDLAAGTEVLPERKDYDNSERCQTCTFSELGDVVFVTLPGNNEVTAVDAYTRDDINTLVTEEAPEGAALHAGSARLFVLNFLGRSMSVFDVADILNGGTTFSLIADVPLVATEPLAAEVLQGKRLFYDASSTQINQSGYLSCATCHLDGAHDGRVYDFTSPMGEGFRNTIDLRGRAGTGHGPVHWTANFDEIHDFEGQLRLLGNGTGLMDDSPFFEGSRSQSLGDPKTGYSTELDALATYVESLDSLPPSPYRNPDGSLTADALAGKTIFNNLACFQCHGGEEFTDSAMGTLHDVGTIKPTSGQRMGQALTGLDTPTLRGIWDTPPYLHDGSAATLIEVLTTANPSDLHGTTSTLTSTEVDQLAAYLRQIDGHEPAATAATGIGAVTYDGYAASYALTGPLSGPGEDFDGDGWENIAELILGGTDPTSAVDRPGLIFSVEPDGSDEAFQVSWLQLEGGIWDGDTYRLGEIAYTPEGSLGLAAWSEAIANVAAPPGLPPAPAGYRWACTRLTLPIGLNPRGFLRIRLNYAP